MSLLSEAAEAGRENEVRRLLDDGADIHWQEDRALKMAALAGQGSTVKLLLERGASPHNPEMNHAMNLAADAGHCACVEAFLDSGTGCSLEEEDGRLLMHLFRKSAMKDDTGMINLLLRRGKAIGTSKEEALRSAASRGNKKSVEVLLNAGADVEQDNGEGDTPLSLAAEYGHTGTVELLINRGANPRAKDDQALRQACLYGHAETIRTLRDLGGYGDSEERDLELLCCVGLRDEAGVKRLLTSGANPAAYANESLICATTHGDTEITRLLLEAGADPNVRRKDRRRFSALTQACSQGNRALVEVLIEAGASIEAHEDAALREALWREKEEIAALLLKHYPTKILKKDLKSLFASGEDPSYTRLLKQELERRAKITSVKIRETGSELEP